MTRKAFVTGWPVSHSLSPTLHGYWLKTLGIDGSYEALPVAEEDFPSFIENFPERGFVGGNITIPHKETAFRHLPHLDAAAQMIGAVNTVWLEDEGLKAGNTDAYGFAANLDDHAPEWSDGKSAVVLGAGGASRAIVFALQARGYEAVHIVNRTPDRARQVSDHFGQGCFSHGLEELGEVLPGTDLFVNTTSIGMEGSGSLSISGLDSLPKNCLVTDIVYTPLMTPLLEFAASRGNRTVDGLGMLLHQAVPGFEKWFGVKPEVTQGLRDHVLAVS